MKHFLRSSFLLITLFLAGCASPYRSIHPESIPFSHSKVESGVEFSYAYDVLSFRKNKKYAKKETKKGLRLVAIKITNNSDKPLRLHENFDLVVGNNPQTPVSPVLAHQTLKQGVWIYMLYLPLNVTLWVNSEPNNYGRTDNGRTVFLPTGPFIAAGNLIVASTANNKFQHDLIQHDLAKKTIEPGKTFYGLVTVQTQMADPLFLRLK